MPSGEFMTIKQAAEILGVSTWWVYRSVWDKNLPAVKLGKNWRIKRQDLENFINSRYNVAN